MTTLQKTIAAWLGLALGAVLVVFFLVSTNTKLNTAATTNTVSFSGQGKITAKPDVALVNLVILTEANSSKVAQDDNAAKSAKVVDFLKKQKVEEKDIKTSGYNIYPQYNYPVGRRAEITGYQVNQTLEVKIRDLANVSKILDGVVTAGVNQVNSLSFQVDDPEKLKAEARELAIKDAKRKANTLQSQLDIRLGHIVNFTEGYTGVPVPVYYDKALSAAGIGGGGPEVPAGENDITVTVQITYQIK